MVVDALTPEEVARHERAIAKIRRKLFARHRPKDFGIFLALKRYCQQGGAAVVPKHRRIPESHLGWAAVYDCHWFIAFRDDCQPLRT